MRSSLLRLGTAGVRVVQGQRGGTWGGLGVAGGRWWRGNAAPTSPPPLLPHPRLCHSNALSPSEPTQGVAVSRVQEEADKLYSMVEVECRGHETAVLRSYLTFVSATASHLNIHLDHIEWPKKHIQRWTLLKSVHIYKKHRVQYETRTHFLHMRFCRLTGSTASTFLEYIQRNLPEGVAMKVTMHELQRLPEHVQPAAELVV